MIHKLISWMRRHYVLTAAGFLVVIAAGFWMFGGNGSESALAEVVRGDIAEEIIVTGKTKPARSAELGFETSGRIGSVSASVGAQVAAGAVVATLDASELRAELAEAEANLGTRTAEASNAGLSQETSREKLEDGMRNAYTVADNAIRNRADRIFSSPRSSQPRLNFWAPHEIESRLEDGRVEIERILVRWLGIASVLDSRSNLDDAALAMRSDFAELTAFLDALALPVNQLEESSTLIASTITDWRANVASARSEVNAASRDFLSAYEAYRRAPTDETARNAEREAAEARVASIRTRLAKTVLRAPFSGVVSRQDATIGEFASAGSLLVGLISASDLEIEANVPEISIGKLRVGNRAAITFDAFPAETFEGRVAVIDPAETLVDGIVNFKITVALAKSDARLKSGLTANLAIETAVRENALVVPQFMIQRDADGAFVWKKNGEATERFPVRVGIFGRNGLAEILDGLDEGDLVAASVVAVE